MKIPQTSGKKARIEIIPLIDVIFFLLATFVLFTISLNKSQGMPVKLPFADTGQPRQTSEETVTLTVTDGGALYWNKDAITLSEFLVRLKDYKLSEPNPKILINGDENALMGQALYVLDEVRKANISQVQIETRVKPVGTIQ